MLLEHLNQVNILVGCIFISETDDSFFTFLFIKPGEYKFSIFGHFMKAIDFGDHDHLGFRMQVSPVGFKVDDLQINGRAYDDAKKNEDVTTLSISNTAGGLSISFPKDYNIGSTANTDPTGETMMPLEGGKTIKIKVHLDGAGGVYIDYLFEKDMLGIGKYFIYDPTVTGVDAPAPAKCGSISDPVAWCKVADAAKFTNGLISAKSESDCKADPCTQADDGATCCEDTSTPAQTSGDCTIAEATAMSKCSEKITNGATYAADMADMDKICSGYQNIMACYPACYCKVDEAIAGIKKITDALATMSLECTLTCGVGPPAAVPAVVPAVVPAPAPATLGAANPSTIGFTSVALIVAALFAVL